MSKELFKEYFSWSRSETRSVILIMIILVAAIIFRITGNAGRRSSHCIDPELLEQVSYFVSEYDKTAGNKPGNYTESFRPQDMPVEKKVEYKPFNPNQDSAGKLIEAGLPVKIASNIVRYRNAGGKFRKPEDIKKIYGMSDSIYDALHAYIVINHKETELFPGEVLKVKPVVSPLPELIDLNKADTTELKRIKGIGSVFASRIVRYRESLGGFYSFGQLYEIRGMDTLKCNYIIQSTFLDTLCIRKININKAAESEIRSHPYLNSHYARSIVYYRQSAGKILSMDELSGNEVLPEETLKKIRYYFIMQEFPGKDQEGSSE